MQNTRAHFHLPGLFEFYDFYRAFLTLYMEHREYFYSWCDISSVYGAPENCIWGGGRFGSGNDNPEEILSFINDCGISARLTFSNSLLEVEHLSDTKCNRLCEVFENHSTVQSGVIIHSELLLEYLKEKYPGLYFVSSTTKVITDFDEFTKELDRDEFRYVVPDFRINNQHDKLKYLSDVQKGKTEFLCNECCYTGCTDRKKCYENVSRRTLGEDCPEHVCRAPEGSEGYRFSKAVKNPSFISREAIKDIYLPSGFSDFKIEGRGLGSALILEFLLYYMVKPEYQINVREHLYLDTMLDLF